MGELQVINGGGGPDWSSVSEVRRRAEVIFPTDIREGVSLAGLSGGSKGWIGGLIWFSILTIMARQPVRRWVLSAAELLARSRQYLIFLRRRGGPALEGIEKAIKLVGSAQEPEARQFILEAAVQTDIRKVRDSLVEAAARLPFTPSTGGFPAAIQIGLDLIRKALLFGRDFRSLVPPHAFRGAGSRPQYAAWNGYRRDEADRLYNFSQKVVAFMRLPTPQGGAALLQLNRELPEPAIRLYFTPVLERFLALLVGGKMAVVQPLCEEVRFLSRQGGNGLSARAVTFIDRALDSLLVNLANEDATALRYATGDALRNLKLGTDHRLHELARRLETALSS